jgi:hypothetical protein
LLAILVLIVLVVAASTWALNGTTLGLQVKCRVFNDIGACFIDALTQPIPQSPAFRTDGSGGGSNGGGNVGGGVPLSLPTPDPYQIQAGEQTQVDDAGTSVTSDMSSLAGSIDAMTPDVASNPGDLKSMATDVATSVSDERIVLTETTNGTDAGTICGDAATVASDASTVQSDESTIESDGSTLQSDYDSIQASITQLQADAAQLASLRASLRSYQDSGPTTAAIASAITTANSATAAAKQGYARNLKQAMVYVATSNGYAAAAQKACDSVP